MPGYVILTCKYHKEGRHWVGVCDQLGTSMFGHTLEEAQERLEEATLLHLNTLEEIGERERFFAENSIPFLTKVPETVNVDIETEEGYFVAPCVQPIKELITA